MHTRSCRESYATYYGKNWHIFEATLVKRQVQYISYIAITNHALIYFREAKILCANLQDMNSY